MQESKIPVQGHCTQIVETCSRINGTSLRFQCRQRDRRLKTQNQLFYELGAEGSHVQQNKSEGEPK